MMRIHTIIAGLWSITLWGMDENYKFLLDIAKPVSVQQIYKASGALVKFPQEKIHDKKILSEILYNLSVCWSDEWANVGIEFAKNLIEKGADPHYPQFETEGFECGKSGPYSCSIIVHTQTAYRTARGKLLDYFVQTFTVKETK
jgi:hypothetical protein